MTTKASVMITALSAQPPWVKIASKAEGQGDQSRPGTMGSVNL